MPLGTGGCCKKVSLASSLVHISFPKDFVYPACGELEFFNQILLFFKILLDLLVSVNIHVIKIIT